MLLFYVSCEDDSDSQLVVSTTQVCFSPNGGTQVIEIESNTQWEIKSDASWLSAYPSVGSLNQSVTITAAVKDNELEEEKKIIIATKDGRKVVNVFVKIEGSEVKSGRYLSVKTDQKTFNGKAKSLDSLEVTSNITWEVLGPQWIETWDGERWRPLSQERGVVLHTGTCTIPLRTVADNKDEASLSDVITVREFLTGEFAYSVSASQLGRMEVNAHFVRNLENGLVFEWHCGCDVANIWYKVTDDMDEHLYAENVRSICSQTDVSFLNSAANLTPDTKYKVMGIGEDANGTWGKKVSTTIITTDKGTTNLGAEIYYARYMEEGLWHFFVAKHPNTYDFSLYATASENSVFRYNDPILMMFASHNLNRGHWFHIWYDVQSGWIPFNMGKSKEIHAMTFSYDKNGNELRKAYRFDRYYDDDGKRLPDKPLLDRIPKSMLDDPSLR